VRVFSAEAFLTGYEPTSIPVATAFGYKPGPTVRIH